MRAKISNIKYYPRNSKSAKSYNLPTSVSLEIPDDLKIGDLEEYLSDILGALEEQGDCLIDDYTVEL